MTKFPKSAALVILALGAIQISTVQAELVFDSQAPSPTNTTQIITVPAQNAPAQPAAPAPVQPQQQQQQPAVIFIQQPAPQAQAQTAPSQISVGPAHVTDEEEAPAPKSEMLRRQRMREELKNEDILKTRLEELRLREEQRLTQNLTQQVSGDAVPMPAAAPVVQPVGPAPVAVEHVRTPVTDASATQTSTAKAGNLMEVGDPLSGATFSISPVFGTSILTNQVYGVDVAARFSTGLSLLAGIGDHFAVEGGYRFSQYGITMLSTNPFVNQAAFNNSYFYGGQMETHTVRQHLAELGARFYFLDRSIRIRPYLGAGVGYSWTFSDYSQQVQQYFMSRGGNTSYQVDALMGVISGGLDVQINRNIAIGVGAKYYLAMAPFYRTNLFANGNPYAGYFGGTSPDKIYIGQSLGATSSFSIMGSATFSF